MCCRAAAGAPVRQTAAIECVVFVGVLIPGNRSDEESSASKRVRNLDGGLRLAARRRKRTEGELTCTDLREQAGAKGTVDGGCDGRTDVRRRLILRAFSLRRSVIERAIPRDRSADCRAGSIASQGRIRSQRLFELRPRIEDA